MPLMHICAYAGSPDAAWGKHVAGIHILCPASSSAFRTCTILFAAVLILLYSMDSHAWLPAEQGLSLVCQATVHSMRSAWRPGHGGLNYAVLDNVVPCSVHTERLSRSSCALRAC